VGGWGGKVYKREGGRNGGGGKGNGFIFPKMGADPGAPRALLQTAPKVFFPRDLFPGGCGKGN